MDSLKKWTDRKSQNILNNDQKHKREDVFQTREQKQTPRTCIYCDKQGHKDSQCESVKSVKDLRLIPSKKKLCFNCTGTKHRISDFRSKKLCRIYSLKHHTSICDKNENVLLTKNSNAYTDLLVIFNIEWIKCCTLVDTEL